MSSNKCCTGLISWLQLLPFAREAAQDLLCLTLQAKQQCMVSPCWNFGQDEAFLANLLSPDRSKVDTSTQILVTSVRICSEIRCRSLQRFIFCLVHGDTRSQVWPLERGNWVLSDRSQLVRWWPKNFVECRGRTILKISSINPYCLIRVETFDFLLASLCGSVMRPGDWCPYMRLPRNTMKRSVLSAPLAG